MGDKQILEQFWIRDERGLAAARRQYGAICQSVAERILGDSRSAEVAVQAAFHQAWKTIPPKRPSNLKGYLLKLTRELTLSQAPWDGEYGTVLGELEHAVPRGEGLLSKKELLHPLNEFLGSLARADRQMFVLRYWYLCTVEEIAGRLGSTIRHVDISLIRSRERLRVFLQEQYTPAVSATLFVRLFGNIQDRWILEAIETKPSLPGWVKPTVAAGVCLAIGLGLFFLLRKKPVKPPVLPPDSTGSTTAEQDTRTAPADTSISPITEQETETVEPENTAGDSPIQDSAAYQKLKSLYYADDLDPVALEALARRIEDEEGFLETYSEGWTLIIYDPIVAIWCYTPLQEDSTRKMYALHYTGDTVDLWGPGEKKYIDLPREVIAEKVYAADSMGLPSDLKEGFVDYIWVSDDFAWNTLAREDDYTSEWSFVYGPLGKLEGDEREFLHLVVNMHPLDDGLEDETYLLFYDGVNIRE